MLDSVCLPLVFSDPIDSGQERGNKDECSKGFISFVVQLVSLPADFPQSGFCLPVWLFRSNG